ncbi:sec-independent protein translocase protein TatC [Actinacidiphila yanglinensis]|uniref:Sec-independent protein translocase protein TatC n=2 Tax=Actinacidiphila yanglinensis TaxID=310779 RepID=A0A1H6B2V7_9ACTN|nr:twin-arginine translocase subunit TatC [Actinacidiphila yanglinensis]SEG54557.1 sec-independent protein translocase protein TatC [Actinacidiphila yanglinensis]
MLKTAARKQTKDPEGRMPLADHLRELRNRLFKSVLAILVVTIVAAFFYKHIIELLQHRIPDNVQCQNGHVHPGEKIRTGACAQMTVSGLLGGFSIALKVSLMAGVVVSSPVWLYQLWAFLAPGLHKSEKRYTLGFVGAGVPLFLAGAVLAYEILPQTARIMIGFVPNDTTNLLPLDDFLDLVARMIVVFGLAFELPLVLVLLNFTGLVTGRRMLGWWRGMVIGITVFAAVATPTGDPLTMSLLAAPIVLLYFLAMGVCFFNDRRRERRRAADPDHALDPDEASSLDYVPEQVDAQSFDAEAERRRADDDFDDAT